MTEGVSLLPVGALFVAIWVAGELFALVRAPLVGQIVVGLVLGPGLLDVVPHTEALALVGLVGLLLLVEGGGLHMDLNTLRVVGWRAVGVGITGTALPVLAGWGLFLLLGFDSTTGLAAGIALAPSSIGIALKLLQQAGEETSQLGSLITTAAMLDDVLSLLLLAIMANLDGGGNDDAGSDDDTGLGVGETAKAIGIPLGTSLIMLIVGGVSHYVFPLLWRFFPMADVMPRDWRQKLLILLMLVYGLTLTVTADLLQSTYLLGAFMGGFSFVKVQGAAELWEHQIGPFEGALSGLFFASIGFSIPLRELFGLKAIGYGLIYTVVSILAKYVTGVFARSIDEGHIVGWAMVGRGELGFLLATEAFHKGLLTELAFSVSVWALFLSTLISPFPFNFLLRRKRIRDSGDIYIDDGGEEDSVGVSNNSNSSIGYQTFGDSADSYPTQRTVGSSSSP